jgi:LL-diaminopimelate aminotransferase
MDKATRSGDQAALPAIREATRLGNLPPYVFAELDRLKTERIARGQDIIDLGMGNPDLPSPPAVVETMQRALTDPANHRYPNFPGLPRFREAVATWCRRRYGVEVDPGREVIPLVGSKEGLAHLAMSVINPGEVTLLPQPNYPAHFRGTILSGGTPYAIPQRPAAELFDGVRSSAGKGRAAAGGTEELLPDLAAIPADILSRARLLILSYPTNPTAFCAPLALFDKALDFARRHRLVLVHDFAYAEIYFDDYRPPSLLSLPGAKEVAVEFHSCSKSFSMAGWRIGFAVGNPAILAMLMKFKSNCDYGLFQAAQLAAATALGLPDAELDATRRIYRQRRDLMVDGLNRLGWRLDKPRATMYLWVPVPPGTNGTEFATRLIDQASLVVSPGSAFGEGGERFIRVALVAGEERLREALARLERAGIRYDPA